MSKHIFCYGDSNTYGFDPRSYFGSRLPETRRWTGLLQAEGAWDILPFGENGREIPHTEAAFRELDTLLRSSPGPDCFAVMLGTNDLFQMPRPSAQAIAARMERLLRWVRAHPAVARDAALLLVAPPVVDVPTCTQICRESAALGAAYCGLARWLGIYFADAGAWGIPTACDGVHFSEEGHAVFARRMSACLHGIFTEQR